MLDRVMLFSVLVVCMASGFNNYLMYKQAVKSEAFFQEVVMSFEEQLDRMESLMVRIDRDHNGDLIDMTDQEKEKEARKRELLDEIRERFEKEFPGEDFSVDAPVY